MVTVKLKMMRVKHSGSQVISILHYYCNVIAHYVRDVDTQP